MYLFSQKDEETMAMAREFGRGDAMIKASKRQRIIDLSKPLAVEQVQF
jgi:hypothetical protein